jgi:hypothetical protein
LLEAEHSPSGRKTPQELADVLVDIAINGLAKPEKKKLGGAFPEADHQSHTTQSA